MSTLTFKKGKKNNQNDKYPHIMVIGQSIMQQIVVNYLKLEYQNSRTVIDGPKTSDVIRDFEQLEPDVVVITNYNLGNMLKLEDVLDRFPAERIIVMCDESTIDKVVPFGTQTTQTKINMKYNLLPLVKKILVLC